MDMSRTLFSVIAVAVKTCFEISIVFFFDFLVFQWKKKDQSEWFEGTTDNFSRLSLWFFFLNFATGLCQSQVHLAMRREIELKSISINGRSAKHEISCRDSIFRSLIVLKSQPTNLMEFLSLLLCKILELRQPLTDKTIQSTSTAYSTHVASLFLSTENVALLGENNFFQALVRQLASSSHFLLHVSRWLSLHCSFNWGNVPTIMQWNSLQSVHRTMADVVTVTPTITFR